MKKFLVLYRFTMAAREQMMRRRRMDAWRASNRNPRLFRLSSDDQA
jgi:hypothetical protein